MLSVRKLDDSCRRRLSGTDGAKLFGRALPVCALLTGWLAMAAVAQEERSIRDLTEPRIREIRMGTLVIHAKPNAKIKVTQQRHEFGFGTALSSDMFDGTWDEWTRSEYLKIVRENFNCAVFENALKWPQSEPERRKPRWEVVDAVVKFCQENEISLRGHCLFWANGEYVPKWAKALNDEDLRRAIAKRIEDVCVRYKGKIADYDVNNESSHFNYFGKRLGPETNDLMFKLAHKADSEAALYVNEYFDPYEGFPAFAKQIRGLVERKVPVGGIGWQGHFSGKVPPYEWTMGILDKLGEFKLPVKITEFDLVAANDEANARGLEDFYRTCFSHPAVDGILMWGFWEGAHWRPRAALWKGKFVPTVAAETYRNLVLKEWWTAWSGEADEKGVCAVKVFFGRHKVEAEGRSVLVELSWKEKQKEITVK